MRIGIDISQLAYPNTGVAFYVERLVKKLIEIDKNNHYVLFFSSLRCKLPWSLLSYPNVTIKRFYFPLSILDLLWNRFHIVPIEWLLGGIDIFISSDWVQPPARRAKLVTILYDLIVYIYPRETDKTIVDTQKRRLRWVKKECDLIFCISEATKKDAIKILQIPEEKIRVVYPAV
jgi:glycosyltransferase involved in cell wall biosynthesis